MKYTIYTIIILLIIVVILQDSYGIIIYNSTNSEPIGLYLTLPIISQIKKGNTYIICVPKFYTPIIKQLMPLVILKRQQSTQCNGTNSLLKKIVASDADKILITKNGIMINSILQKNTISFDSGLGVNLHPLPIGWQVVLKNNQYFVLGQTSHSVDSRYFGIITKQNILKRAIFLTKRDLFLW